MLFASLALAVVLILVRHTIERSLLTDLIQRSTGAAVSMGAISDGLGSVRIDDLHLDAAGMEFEAAATAVSFNRPISITLTAPRLHVRTDTPAGEQSATPASTIAWLESLRAYVRIQNGGADVRSGPAADPALTIAGAQGQVSFAPAGTTYHLDGNVMDAGTPYPVHASANATTSTWTADALPLTVLNAFTAPSSLTVTAGLARDVAVRIDGTFSASTTLDAAKGTVAGTPIQLSGPVAVLDDRIGSTGLTGTLRNVPFSFTGEAHDFTKPATALREGTRDLQATARLAAFIGTQQHLTFARIELTAPGIVFGQYGITSPAGPHVVQLLTVDPSESTVHFDTALASDHVISKGERTSDLALRTNAVAGVNGDYFDIGRSYEPQGMLIKTGTLIRSPADRAAMIIDRSNHATFSEFRLNGTVLLDGHTFPITQFNSWPLKDATIITPDYGLTLQPAAGVTFARLEPVNEAKHTYRISRVEKADQPLPVSFGVAFGPELKDAHPKEGDIVTVSYALSPPVGPDVVAGIGGGPILLRNGEWYEDPHAPAPDERDVRWPVVALGTRSDGTLVFASVDGRHPERSVGLTRPEFADLLRSFEVTDAMALDSGGSVTMVARTPGDAKPTVHNKPSDDSLERYISDALLVFSSASPNTIVTATPVPSPSPGT